MTHIVYPTYCKEPRSITSGRFHYRHENQDDLANERLVKWCTHIYAPLLPQLGSVGPTQPAVCNRRETVRDCLVTLSLAATISGIVLGYPKL